MRRRGAYWAGLVGALVVGLVAGGLLGRTLWAEDEKPEGKGNYHDVDHAELVLYEARWQLPRNITTILRSTADVTQFAGRFADSDTEGTGPGQLEKLLSARNFDTEALITFSAGSGCATGDGAELTSSGGANYSVRVTGIENPPQTCYRPYAYFAVFAVPKADVPSTARLQGMPPNPPGPAKLLTFEQVARTEPRGAEISQLDQLETFLPGLPLGTASEVRAAVLDRPKGTRAFGFVLDGCRNDSAYLVISKQRLRPVLTGGEKVTCVAAESYLAVFTLSYDDVPATARIG
ncbi:hypothetical protein [Nocardia sp. NPDC051832]|uniref:hypothetical protein n=1 Tax=Nocardia sp. NPDC051832 TaxID=3155673 RepID=UPI00343F51D4